jgi:hypothetical protein
MEWCGGNEANFLAEYDDEYKRFRFGGVVDIKEVYKQTGLNDPYKTSLKVRE